MYGFLATLPSGTSTLAQIGAYSSPVFDDLLPFAVFAAGLIVGVALVAFIIVSVGRAFHRD